MPLSLVSSQLSALSFRISDLNCSEYSQEPTHTGYYFGHVPPYLIAG